MRSRGINYDTGFTPGGKLSRSGFDLADVRRELRVIAEELHCTSVRISGADPERIGQAAAIAAEFGLEVWFAPFPCDLTAEEMLPLFEDCATRAERLRLDGIMSGKPETYAAFATAPAAVTAFLAQAAAAVRARFGGRITYASGLWEDIDWTPFDIVSVDAYRDKENADTFQDQVAARTRFGKPVAITEFGCCTYSGAGERGGMGWAIVDDKADPPRIDGDYVRDEQEQVRYLQDHLEIFEEVGVDTALWFTFASYNAPYNPDPQYDLDTAGYSVVRLTDGVLTPKAVFAVMAEAYRR